MEAICLTVVILAMLGRDVGIYLLQRAERRELRQAAEREAQSMTQAQVAQALNAAPGGVADPGGFKTEISAQDWERYGPRPLTTFR